MSFIQSLGLTNDIFAVKENSTQALTARMLKHILATFISHKLNIKYYGIIGIHINLINHIKNTTFS
jgi:hypothetical protein